MLPLKAENINSVVINGNKEFLMKLLKYMVKSRITKFILRKNQIKF